MSDNIPTTSLPRKRSRKKYDKTKLPTPPPDPTEKDDFFAYLDSLQKSSLLYSRSPSFAPVIATEDAFDHLEKLYKLMEQMLELREQNARLHRRVQDLEHLNNLEKMHKELNDHIQDDCPELDKDTAFAETILESILSETKTKPKILTHSKLRQSISRKRTRSGSVSTPSQSHLEPPEKSDRRASASTVVLGHKKPSKVSKWTKVKAAFKWEKASPTVGVSDAKSQDSGIGGWAGVEVARYLRVPSCDEHGHSPVDSGAAEISTPGTLSTASSNEDFHRHDGEELKSSDDEHNYIPHSKEGSQKSNKTHKTPWAKMKDIIQTRNSLKKKRLSAQSDDIQIDVELCSDNEDNVFEESEIPADVVERYQAMGDSIDGKKISKWTRVKKAFLPEQIIEDEIQKNYKQLQKKLSLEFQEKLTEWERMKQNSPCTSNPSPCTFDDSKVKSENLPPEFRKKLQEWEKIRKNSKKKLADVPRWKSLSAPKSEYPNLSDDFRKKLEEWKQIKASPQQNRKESERIKKAKERSELQWFEKELSKIEKEKQRLERERQRFLERETKLRNSGSLKKEVLIHTPSGFYRFEGISRKFTQKLYEWEKAQGIAPEFSTFALLNSSLNQRSDLVRSKSADSIAISALNLACPLMSHQPSSLSLNDVEDLEKECLGSRSSVDVDVDEPEAIIVEVEDVYEETAEALHMFAERTQQPVYQREELKLCEGEMCLAPKIRRSESARAQNNYNLIEEIFSILKNLGENEAEIQRVQDVGGDEGHSELIRLKMFDESQKAMSVRLNEKVSRLQEANSHVFANITKEEDFSPKQIVETLEIVQDLSTEISQLTEKLDFEITNRNVYETSNEGACSLNPITEISKEIKSKMLELRRRLSYICAASDLTAPRKYSNIKNRKKNDENNEKNRLYIKSETSNAQSQGAVKKRIRYRQKSQRTLADTDEEEDVETKRNTHKKLTRTRSVSTEENEVKIDESIIQKVVVPTQSNILNVCSDEIKSPDSPVTVFVKTTRKLFTPLVESSGFKAEEEGKNLDDSSENSVITHLPPLPSPVPLRKTKDISPSIKIMMAKYNEKISQDSQSVKSANNSGSASPVAWRSPAAERRVKAQTEKYQELNIKREVQKSASDGIFHANFTEIRLLKLQKAKEEFMNSQPKVQRNEEVIKFPERNRLSQISVDSESSLDSACGTLIKSASAGMINVDADVYKQFDPEVRGYVSLPRNVKKPKEGFLSGKFSNIASKFRKVKMRKGKEKIGAVSALCRQSLVVDIEPLLKKNEEETTSTSKSSWIKKPKLFK